MKQQKIKEEARKWAEFLYSAYKRSKIKKG